MLGGQLAHLNGTHLTLNLVGLWLIAWGFQPWMTGRQLMIGLFTGMAGVAVGLLRHPDIHWYAGLSGALHGLMAYALLNTWQSAARSTKTRHWTALIAAGVMLKLAVEQFAPELLTGHNDMGAPVLRDAHGWGLLGGLLLWPLTLLTQRLQSRRTP